MAGSTNLRALTFTTEINWTFIIKIKIEDIILLIHIECITLKKLINFLIYK